MSDEELIDLIRQGIAKRRGYADGRSWPVDRNLEERGIAEDFVAAARNEPGGPFAPPLHRERGQDPPDCETIDYQGRAIALEITELVDQRAVESVAACRNVPSATWTAEKLVERIQAALSKKDFRDRLIGGPYHEYFVIIFTAEPDLDADTVERWLKPHKFNRPAGIDRAYLSLDYVPGAEYPLVRLVW